MIDRSKRIADARRKERRETVREIEVRCRGAKCSQVFEQARPSYPLPRRKGADHYSGRETLRRRLG
jgi:hypothetical protein